MCLTNDYDSLNRGVEQCGRVVSVGNPLGGVFPFCYDTLGNLVYELFHNKDNYIYTFDNRGNLVQGEYQKNKNQTSIVEAYLYDETNRMIAGVNSIGEASAYIYNGLGHLVGQSMAIKRNAYGYTGVSGTEGLYSFGDFATAFATEMDASIDSIVAEQSIPGGGSTHGSGSVGPSTLAGLLAMFPQIETAPPEGQPLVLLLDPDGPAGAGEVRFQLPHELVEALGNGNINQTTVVEKTFVLDYTSPLANVIVKRREVAADARKALHAALWP